MAQCLHGIGPEILGLRSPSSIAVELLEILNHGLHKPQCLGFSKVPYLRDVYEDAMVNDTSRLEIIYDLLCTVDNGKFLVKIVILINRAGLELFPNARLPSARSACVCTCVNIFERPFCEDF